jgi:hypothetical protein
MAPQGESWSASARTRLTKEGMEDDAGDARSESVKAIIVSSVSSSEHEPPSDNPCDEDDDDNDNDDVEVDVVDEPKKVSVSDSRTVADTEMNGQERMGAQGGTEEPKDEKGDEKEEEYIDDRAPPFDGNERSAMGTTGAWVNDHEGVPSAKPAWGWRIRSLRQRIAIRNVAPENEKTGKLSSESYPETSTILPPGSAPMMVPPCGPSSSTLVGNTPFVSSASESSTSVIYDPASQERKGAQERKEEQEEKEEEYCTDDVSQLEGDERSTAGLGGRDSEDMPSAKPVWGRRIRSLQQRLASRNRLPEEDGPEKSCNPGSSTAPLAIPAATTTTKEDIEKALGATNGKQDLESFRPGTISVTVFKEAVDTRLGIGLQAQAEEKVAGQSSQPQHQSGSTTIGRPQVVEIGYLSRDQDDLLCHSPLHVGDVIKMVNNQKCTNLDDTRKLLQDVQGKLTLTVETLRGNPLLVQAMVTKPTVDTMLGLGFFNVPRPRGASLLQINHISPQGLVAHSVLSQGCLVLAINGTPCCHFKADAGSDLIQRVRNAWPNILTLSQNVSEMR